MEKIVEFSPAFDKRDPKPSKNYGIHGVDLRMILKGEKGVVQFVVYTNWHLPHVQEELNRKATLKQDERYIEAILNPMPADLGYHSPTPIYEGQSVCSDSCGYLDGKPCYYDGSGLNAERIYEVLLKEGSDGVWRELEEYYKDVFESED
jgi:hypothetical protein